MIEILTRLGLALTLSLFIALLLAWGWDHSEHASVPTEQAVADAAIGDAPVANTR